ncbi:MAG: MMPL family transporter, partial [Deltaproteobacteria bacterium]|nr:MMPL family transporter [Deltaproteobacteria bacterium]
FFKGPSADLEFGRSAIQKAREIDAKLRDGIRFPKDLEVHFAGGIPIRVEDDQAMRKDLFIAGSLGFLAVVVLIVISLKSPRALLIIGFPLFIGLLWTAAFAYLAVGHLNLISGFLFSILSGLGIEYAIHLLHRFHELRDEGTTPEESIIRLVERTGRAVLSGSITNASIFLIVGFSRFSGFSEFGLIAAVGLLLTWIATILFLPPLLLLFERWKPTKSKNAQTKENSYLRLPALVRYVILFGFPLLSILTLHWVYTGKLAFNANWRLLAGQSEASKFHEYLRHELSGLFTGAMIYAKSDNDLKDIIETIRKVQRERLQNGLKSAIVEINTIEEAIPSEIHQKRRVEIARRIARELRRIPIETLETQKQKEFREAIDVLESLRPLRKDEWPYALVGPFLTSKGEGSMVHLRMAESDEASIQGLVEWAEEARAIAKALRQGGLSAPMLSENWIAGEIFERIVGDAPYLLFGTICAVFFVLLLDLRKPLAAFAILGAVMLVSSPRALEWCVLGSRSTS